ncbi:DMT family transporter [Desulfamplus magnetovallimortis]|nr:DMT family transporter [Desulfamplus magnetovallimortis]
MKYLKSSNRSLQSSATLPMNLIETSGFLPVAALLAAVVLWGASFAFMRTALQTLNPWAVMWLRMIIGLFCIIPVIPGMFAGAYKKGDWKILLPTVMFQPCIYFFLESRALLFTTSSQAGIISSFVPLMVTVGAWIFLSEKLKWQNSAGICISITGVVGLTLFADSRATAVNPLLGNMLEVGAMAAAAANIILVKQLSGRYNPWHLTAMQLLAGTIFFLPGLKQILCLPSDTWTVQLILILIFLGAFVSLGAFGLYNWGMSKITASKASSFINLVPVTAVIIGWSMLGESLNGIQCIAAALVIAGVLLSQSREKDL